MRCVANLNGGDFVDHVADFIQGYRTVADQGNAFFGFEIRRNRSAFVFDNALVAEPDFIFNPDNVGRCRCARLFGLFLEFGRGFHFPFQRSVHAGGNGTGADQSDQAQTHLRKTEKYMAVQYDYIEEILPKEIAFVSTQELVDMYPDLTPKEREYKIVKEKGAVFLMQVGKTLSNGERHDGRAPDYDDWELNGDILVYYPVLDIALELSSMGIRVDEDSLDSQLTEAGCDDRRELPFQKAILNKELPYTIGGGIGQSRICMFFLRKAHIGEVHVSIWPESVRKAAEEGGVNLL